MKRIEIILKSWNHFDADNSDLARFCPPPKVHRRDKKLLGPRAQSLPNSAGSPLEHLV